MASYRVGAAAKAAGITSRAVRLYESKGLVPSADRTPAGYRLFTDEDIEVLTFIRRGRSLGLSLDAIAEIIAISDDGAPCDRTRALLTQRVEEIDAAIADLQRLRQVITRAQHVKVDAPAGSRCVLIDQVADTT